MSNGSEGEMSPEAADSNSDADHAVTDKTPTEAAKRADGISERVRAVAAALTPEERYVTAGLGAFVGLLWFATAFGILNVTYLLYLLSIAGMYLLLSMGLNVQWGYTGLINFSVAAFFGVGAYGTALLTADSSPIAGGYPPFVGLVVGLLAAGVLAVLIGIPTLRLREDYLAIATLGLAEVVRAFILNEQQWTAGSAGLTGIPLFFANWPVVGDISGTVVALLNVLLVSAFVLIVYLFLRRVHRAPWGRVQRTIRADENLAETLGKNAYMFKMQSFVIGSIIMALAGVFYTHLTLFLSPTALDPTRTFYVWIAVILGGTGSDRGAMLGGLILVIILQGTRFLGGGLPISPGALKLLLTGIIIIALIRYRQQGILPPQRELIWPGSFHGGKNDE
jgi:ABC-type branched-subunit amino acid transport system permease subunit